jgi:hypothetical protein
VESNLSPVVRSAGWVGQVVPAGSERLTLRKAEAMRLLLDRGYQIGLEDLK